MCGGKMKTVSGPILQQPVDNGTIRTHRLLILIACLLSLLIFQNYQSACYLSAGANGVESLNVADVKAVPELVRGRRLSESTTASTVNAIAPLDVAPHPMYRRAPPNLPSVLKKAGELDVTGLSATEINAVRIYGGKGDAGHLGGFTDFDPMGLSDNVFNWMLGPLGIKSVIDVGCGKGVSTSEFKKKGAHVLCVEGSHDATSQSLLPAHEVVEHDFARGPWWPSETFDAAWSVEFLEHVGRPYMQNYLPIFKKAALLFVTSSGWGGWHHVEVHPHSWWRHRFEAQGFVFSEELTLKVRKMAANIHTNISQHIQHGMRVFINPTVASLPNHHHLFAGNGCYGGSIDNRKGGAPCKDADALPTDYIPLMDCKPPKAPFVNRLQFTVFEWMCQRDERATYPAQFKGTLP